MQFGVQMCLNRCFLFCSSSYLIFFLSTCYCSWTHISFLLLFLPVPKTCGQNSKTQPAVFLGFLHNVWSEIDWRAQTVTLINLAIVDMYVSSCCCARLESHDLHGPAPYAVGSPVRVRAPSNCRLQAAGTQSLKLNNS